MKNKAVVSIILLTVFLDFFNLGLIYPIFSSLIYENAGGLISSTSSDFYKTSIFGVLIGAFPFGQFLSSPVIGLFSDRYGRKELLTLSLIGTVVTLLMCAFGVIFSSLFLLLLGRFAGGLMAGNMTIAYASLADLSTPEDKVRNFALIPFVIGIGFALGPYLAGILANPNTHSLAGPALPLFTAAVFSLINLLLVWWRFPETLQEKPKDTTPIHYFKNFNLLWKSFKNPFFRPYLWIVFLMISSNLVFVQFIGPFAIERFHISVTEVGYLYANAGIAVALGHIFLTRQLPKWFSVEASLKIGLLAMGLFLICFVFTFNFIFLHILTFFMMLSCAVAYTNSMALLSNRAEKEKQGEIMGVAVSIQSCSEFLPATLLGMVAFLSQSIPLLAASGFALLAWSILASVKDASTEKKKDLASSS